MSDIAILQACPPSSVNHICVLMLISIYNQNILSWFLNKLSNTRYFGKPHCLTLFAYLSKYQHYYSVMQFYRVLLGPLWSDFKKRWCQFHSNFNIWWWPFTLLSAHCLSLCWNIQVSKLKNFWCSKKLMLNQNWSVKALFDCFVKHFH